MDLGIRGKVAIVSGGSAGIGAAVAVTLAGEGASVVICGRNRERLETTVNDAKKDTNGEVVGVTADCTKQSEVARLVDSTVSRFGGVDILVNSLSAPRSADFFETTDEDWIESLNGKLLGQIRCARAVLPIMMSRKSGRIVNIIGTHAHHPHSYLLTAGVVNAGLQNFTKALAELVAPHNILVNAVNPGPIETERMQYIYEVQNKVFGTDNVEARRQWEDATLLKRYGRPAEVAAAVVFLVSEQAGYITGATINVDGGLTKCI